MLAVTHASPLRRDLHGALRTLLGLVALATVGTGANVHAATGGGGGRFTPPHGGYHDAAAVRTLVDDWIAADPDRVRRIDLGTSAGGLPVPAIAFDCGREPLEAGPGFERRTLLLLGGLDGRSQAGSEAVLRATHRLLVQLDHLPADIEVVSVPWASPDGLARVGGGACTVDGRDATAVDDDLDGRAGEDGGDDVDGDDRILEMLLPDPDGAWCFAEDTRFLARAGPEDAPRYERVVEGYDDDGDGLFNEDGLGGLDLDRQFPLGWRGPGPDGECGERPLASPLARRLADLMLERHVVLAFVFQGAHGGVRVPRDSSPERLAVQRRLARAYAVASGRAEERIIAEGEGDSGRFVDWLHGAVGVTAVEIAVWGPDAVGHDGRPVLSALDARPPIDRGGVPLRGGPGLDDGQRRWARWLDDVRGGAGFTDWHPVDLGGGRTGWVGGWGARTRWNPPSDALEPALAGVVPFIQTVVVSLPRISIELVRMERRGDLVELEVKITNRGELPTALGDVVHEDAGAIEVRLEAACDAQVLAGPHVEHVRGLGGGETSRALRWIVTAHEGTSIAIAAESRHAGSARREVRP